MRTFSKEPQSSERTPGWLDLAYLDEPGVRSLNAFICELTATRELHDALRLISGQVRAFLAARFVAVVVFEDERQALVGEVADATTIAVPLRVAGRNVGQITAYFDRPRTFTTAEVQVMGVIAAVAAVTLENARWLQRERKRLMQAEAINSLAPHLAMAKTHDEMARIVVGALKAKLHYHSVRLLWRADDADGLTCLASTRGAGASGTCPTPVSDTISQVLREGVPLLVGDRSDWHDGVGDTDLGLRSLLSVPIRSGTKILGVLEVGARSPGAFDNGDLTTITSLASQMAAVNERIGVPGREQARSASDADRGRGELVSLFVHDLRGPLSLVKGYASTLLHLGESLDNQKRRRFLAGIDEAADRLAMMVDHLAGASRLESGEFQPKLRDVDLTQLVTETVERLRRQLGDHPISLELPGGILPVQVDYEHVSRAVGNLLQNAGRQSPLGSRITVRVVGQSSSERDNPSAIQGASRSEVAKHVGYGQVEVHDEGPGIQREHLERVFDKLYRWPAGDGRKKGSGLELYVTKKIIEAHGGCVWAESGLGQGSTLGFVLPIDGQAVQ